MVEKESEKALVQEALEASSPIQILLKRCHNPLIKGLIYKWKNLTRDVANEFWTARVKSGTSERMAARQLAQELGRPEEEDAIRLKIRREKEIREGGTTVPKSQFSANSCRGWQQYCYDSGLSQARIKK